MKADQLSKFTIELTNSWNPEFLPLNSSLIEKFKSYYKIVLKWNEFIPLTTITDPVDFAQKHILESLFAETFIPKSVNEIWDIGTGLGVPGVPVAIIRPESQIFLIEANKKKAIFLKEVVHLLQLSNIKVINHRFESLPPFNPESCIVSRALDDLKHLLPKILERTIESKLTLLLGTSELFPTTQNLLASSTRQLKSNKIPKSKDRLIISIESCT